MHTLPWGWMFVGAEQQINVGSDTFPSFANEALHDAETVSLRETAAPLPGQENTTHQVA